MSADSSSSPSSSDADHHTLSTKTTFSPDATPTRLTRDAHIPPVSAQTLKRPRSPELFGEEEEDATMDDAQENRVAQEDTDDDADSVAPDDSGHASSSLSEQSSLSPSPPPPTIRRLPTRRNGRQPSKGLGGRGESGLGENGGTSNLGETTTDSGSDTEEVDEEEEEQDEDERGPSGSTTPSRGGRGRARGVRGGRGSRGRGRPRGKRIFAHRQGPTRASPVAPPKSKPLPDPSAPPPRATRATVTLPPGYIEGVKSARMTRKRSASDTPTPSPAPAEKAVVQIQTLEKDEEEREDEDEDAEDVEEEEAETETETPVEAEKEVEDEEEKEEEEEEEVKPKKLLKGKEKERESPAEPERTLSKRRRVDEGALERAAQRAEQTRVLLEQLDREAELIRNSEHPLIAATLEKLAEGKALKLRQLAEYLDQRETEYARQLRANTEITWRRWADAKEALREELYFQNHDSLKQLIAEEKAYPYLRDHPLLVNTRDLPLIPYFRRPLTQDVADLYPPRTRSYTWAALEPPPVNRAYDHSTWELSASEVASDIAILTELSKPAAGAALLPPPMPYPPYASFDNLTNPMGPAAFSLAPPYAHHAGPPPHIPYYGGAPWPGMYEQLPPPPPPHARSPALPSQQKTNQPTVSQVSRTNFDIPPPRTNFDSSTSHRQPASSGSAHARAPNPPSHSHNYGPPASAQESRQRPTPLTAASVAKSSHPASVADHQQRPMAPGQVGWQTLKTPWGSPSLAPVYAPPPPPPPKPPTIGVGRLNPFNRPGDW